MVTNQVVKLPPCESERERVGPSSRGTGTLSRVGYAETMAGTVRVDPTCHREDGVLLVAGTTSPQEAKRVVGMPGKGFLDASLHV